MLLKHFKVTAIDSDLRAILKARGERTSWDVIANSLPSAWSKFVHQRFGALKPDSSHYDICLDRVESV